MTTLHEQAEALMDSLNAFYPQSLFANRKHIDESKSEDIAKILAFAEQIQAQERARTEIIVAEKSRAIEDSFINCDEINAYRLACEHIAQAILEQD